MNGDDFKDAAGIDPFDRFPSEPGQQLQHMPLTPIDHIFSSGEHTFSKDTLGVSRNLPGANPELLAKAIDLYADPRTEEVYYVEDRVVVVTHRALRTGPLPDDDVFEISPQDFKTVKRLEYLLHMTEGLTLVGTPQRREVPLPPDVLKERLHEIEVACPLGVFYSDKFAVVVVDPNPDGSVSVVWPETKDGYIVLTLSRDVWMEKKVLSRAVGDVSLIYDLRTLFSLPCS